MGLTHSSYDHVHVLSVKSYPWFLSGLGFPGTFAVCTAVCAINAAYGAWAIRPSAGLSLVEVESQYEGNKRKSMLKQNSQIQIGRQPTEI